MWVRLRVEPACPAAARNAGYVAKVGMVGIVALLGLGLSGCSSSSARSVATYCTTFYQKGGQLRNEFLSASAKKDPLIAIVDLITAPAQLADFFGDLATVAPQTIETQVQQIQKAFQKEVDNATGDISNPVGGIISGLASAIETGPAWSAVTHWTDTNCGPPPGTKWLKG